MNKRYSEKEKRQAVKMYLSSGQSRSSIARGLGISALTLKAWATRYGPVDDDGGRVGFEPLLPPASTGAGRLRLHVGGVQVELEGLPSAEWFSAFIKGLGL